MDSQQSKHSFIESIHLNGNLSAEANSLATFISFRVQNQTRDMILKMLLKDTIQEKNISKTLPAMIAMIDLSMQFKILKKNNIN